MKITVTADKPQDNQLVAKLTVDSADVDRAIKHAYSDIAQKYRFQGFRKGHAPRPMIDAVMGRDAVLAQATNELLNDAEPLLLEELDIVPVGEVSFGDEPALVVEGSDYETEVTLPVRPACELDSYDAPAIEMPPAEATEAEIAEQLDQLMSYRTTYEDIEEDRPAAAGDIVSVDVESIEGGEGLAGKNRLLSLDGHGLPKDFEEAVVGMSKGETKDVSWTSGEGDNATNITVKVTLNAIKHAVTPELTDEVAKESFGYDTVDELREAMKSEIENDKRTSLPGLKEDRLVTALAEHLTLEEVPENYVEQVFNETAQNFLSQLQAQGLTLDTFLQMRGIQPQDFINDLREQSAERARQSLALDALAEHLGFEATEDDVKAEFEKSGAENPEDLRKQWRDAGRLPAVRESVKRTKALNWLVDNAAVTEVDEVARRRAEREEASESTEESGE